MNSLKYFEDLKQLKKHAKVKEYLTKQRACHIKHKLMDEEDSKDIFKYVNLIEIQKLLINYPQLYILFEFTCLHINSLIKI